MGAWGGPTRWHLLNYVQLGVNEDTACFFSDVKTGNLLWNSGLWTRAGCAVLLEFAWKGLGWWQLYRVSVAGKSDSLVPPPARQPLFVRATFCECFFEPSWPMDVWWSHLEERRDRVEKAGLEFHLIADAVRKSVASLWACKTVEQLEALLAVGLFTPSKGRGCRVEQFTLPVYHPKTGRLVLALPFWPSHLEPARFLAPTVLTLDMALGHSRQANPNPSTWPKWLRDFASSSLK